MRNSRSGGSSGGGGSGKLSMPMHLVFENLFKLDPVLHGMTPSTSIPQSPPAMVLIREESTTAENINSLASCPYPEGRKLFKKNSTNSLGRRPKQYNPNSPATLPTEGFQSLGLSGHFETQRFERTERSGSTKSYAKNRSPLSRIWQMRRRSFSHFELCSDSSNEQIPPIGGTRGPGSAEIDAPYIGASGYFSLLDEAHWESETDISISTLSVNDLNCDVGLI